MMTENTRNFCRHHAPFRTGETRRPGEAIKFSVLDRLGMNVCLCERIDDAWVIAEALNAAGEHKDKEEILTADKRR